MAPKSMLSVEDAEKAIAAFPVTVRTEIVPLAAAHDRFLARDIVSPLPLPEFDKSAMDGYAYYHKILRPSTRSLRSSPPVRLQDRRSPPATAPGS